MGNSNRTQLIEYSPSEDLDDIPPALRIFCIVLQSVLAVTGTSGNLLTLIAVFSCKKLRRTHNVYIANLAFVDLLISGVLVPINIFGLAHHKSGDTSVACTVIAVISLAALVSSILSLFMVALNRYVLICKGLHTYVKIYNSRTVPFTIGAVWLWAFAVVLPMISFDGLGWSAKTHYCFFVNYDSTTYIYITAALAQAGVVIPAAGTSLCYVLIIRKLRESARKLAPKAITSATKEMTLTSSNGGGQEVTALPAEASTSVDEDDYGEQEQLENKKTTANALAKPGKGMSLVANEHLKRQRAKNRTHNRRVIGLILIFMIFMICWLPIAVTFTIDYQQQLPGLVYVLLISIAWINSSINVYLYAFTNHLYRHAFICILKCRFSQINSKL